MNEDLVLHIIGVILTNEISGKLVNLRIYNGGIKDLVIKRPVRGIAIQ